MRVFIAVPKFSMIEFEHHSLKHTYHHSIFEVEMTSVPRIGEEISATQGKVMLIIQRIIWERPESRDEHYPVLFCKVTTDDRKLPRD